uniref:C2H2-type domain-containing protein n=1 Tax=Neogobius melanostomus TaxID=47308 RepID=A0A8C6WHP8_9GOBI
ITSQSKFQCGQCQSEFNTATDLSIHLKLHDAEKEVGEYRCDMCYKSFGQLQLLRRHQESHVGQKPFSCPECGKRFTKKSNLNLHLKTSDCDLKQKYCIGFFPPP